MAYESQTKIIMKMWGSLFNYGISRPLLGNDFLHEKHNSPFSQLLLVSLSS